MENKNNPYSPSPRDPDARLLQEKSKQSIFNKEKQNKSEKEKTAKVRLNDLRAPNHQQVMKLNSNDIYNSSFNQQHPETVRRRKIRCTAMAVSTIPNVEPRSCLNREGMKSSKAIFLPRIDSEQIYENQGDKSVQAKVIRPKKPALDKFPLINEHTLPKIYSIQIHQQAKAKSKGSGIGVPTLDRGNQKSDSTNLNGITKHQCIRVKKRLSALWSRFQVDNGYVTNPNILEDRAQKPPFDTKVNNKELKKRFFRQ